MNDARDAHANLQPDGLPVNDMFVTDDDSTAYYYMMSR